jgi:hypothetical protein
LKSRIPLLLATACLGALALSTASAHAFGNPNNALCHGHIEQGEPEPGDTNTQVAYVFGCNVPITGYQIQADQAIESFDTATLAIGGDGNPVPTDGFTCNGDFPGIAFNCIGTFSGALIDNKFETVTGQFSIAGKLCAEPRVDPLLTIVSASVSSTGAVTQAISGPYDLGRPLHCPKSAQSGSARIGPEGIPVHKATVKAKSKAKAKAKKARKPTHRRHQVRRHR